MDLITMVLVALASGVAIGARDTASEAVRDSYRCLKDLIRNKFKGRADYERTLAKFEKNPETWRLPLREVLSDLAVDRDREIKKAAEKLLSLAKPKQSVVSKYNLQVTGDAIGVVQGDDSEVSIVFSDRFNEE